MQQTCSGIDESRETDSSTIRKPVGAAGAVAAPWMIVTVRPATVRAPVRDADVGFRATVKPTEPCPDIDAPLVMVIQAALLVAVHAQRDPVVTATLPPVPVDGAETLVGEML